MVWLLLFTSLHSFSNNAIISVFMHLCYQDPVFPRDTGEGPRLSLSRAHVHDNTHTTQKPTTERGSQAFVNTVREETVKTVFLFGGYFGEHLFASQTNLYVTYTHSIKGHLNDSENQKARIVTCLKNLLNRPMLSQSLQN